MKKIGIFFLLISFSAFGQKYNIKKGFIAEGYDVVAYFNNTSIKGDKKFTSEFKGVPFKFSSKENLVTFNKSPQSYVPQYGGFCAYAIGVRGEKVAINPKTFEIRKGKLYLFYNSWGTNTLDLWKQEGAEKLRKQADENWKRIVNSFE
jgi:YHS domain-containing protein